MKKTSLRQNVTNSDRKWYVINAIDKPLGKVAVEVAKTLRGKNRVDVTPHVDGGGYVVILNSEKVKVSGKKEEQKKYYRHSGYLGHLKEKTLKEMRAQKPEFILKNAVSGMLSKNKHRDAQLRRLFIVVGETNPHEAQSPELLNL